MWPKSTLTPQERYAATIGFGAVFVFVGAAPSAPTWPVSHTLSGLPLSALGLYLPLEGNGGWGFWIWGVILSFIAFGATLLIVLQHRYKQIPTADRPTPSAFHQMWFVAARSITQQLRFWPGLAFDLFLPVMVRAAHSALRPSLCAHQ